MSPFGNKGKSGGGGGAFLCFGGGKKPQPKPPQQQPMRNTNTPMTATPQRNSNQQ